MEAFVQHGVSEIWRTRVPLLGGRGALAPSRGVNRRPCRRVRTGSVMAAGAPTRTPTALDKDGPHGGARLQVWLVTRWHGESARAPITGAISRQYNPANN